MQKVIKVGKDLAIILPKEVVNNLGLTDGSVVIIKHIHGNVYAFYPSEEEEERLVEEVVEEVLDKGGLDKEEIELLKKLKGIKFSERTGQGLKKSLSKREFEILKKLVKKGVVLYMKTGKYKSKGGVYSISKNYYSQINEKVGKNKEMVKSDIEREVENKGYLVVKSLEGLEGIKPKLETGEYVIVKGFDGFYYLIKSQLLSDLGEKIKKLLKNGPMSLAEITAHTRKDKKLVKAVLEVLREAGDIMERKKEVYELV